MGKSGKHKVNEHGRRSDTASYARAEARTHIAALTSKLEETVRTKNEFREKMDQEFHNHQTEMEELRTMYKGRILQLEAALRQVASGDVLRSVGLSDAAPRVRAR